MKQFSRIAFAIKLEALYQHSLNNAFNDTRRRWFKAVAPTWDFYPPLQLRIKR